MAPVRAFPLSTLVVSLGQDAEDETHRYIAIDVKVGGKPIEDVLRGQRMWSSGIVKVCPSPDAVYFVLGWK